jgi:dihydroflavonol-4-reductase/farnesol dehydrogenase
MKTLVTGATGFIGRQLCLALAGQGIDVVALCRNVNHPLLIRHKNVTVCGGDVTDKESLQRAMKDCTAAFHTAALARMWCKNTQDFYEVNVKGTTNVLEAAAFAGVQKIVHTSSCGVIGPTHQYPMTESDPRIIGFAINYERTKYLAELEVQKFAKKEMDIVIVSPSRVYGQGPVTESNTVGKMIEAYLKGRWRLLPGDGKQVVNYAYLDDVVNGHIAAMQKGRAGNRYILGGEDISFNAFFGHLQSASGKHYRLLHVPQQLIKLYSHMEKFKTTVTGAAPRFLPEFADRLKYHQKYSSCKAVAELGYKITPFELGMNRTIEYFKTSHI